MEDKTKHVIAHAIYTICKILARELRFVLKPLGIVIIIFTICLVVGWWCEMIFNFQYSKDCFIPLGMIGFFLPTIVKYYKRIQAWVLKWK